MNPTATPEAAAPTPMDLATGIEALWTAANQLSTASAQVEAASEVADGAQLLAEEIRDVLVRVRAEREKLAAMLAGD